MNPVSFGLLGPCDKRIMGMKLLSHLDVSLNIQPSRIIGLLQVPNGELENNHY